MCPASGDRRYLYLILFTCFVRNKTSPRLPCSAPPTLWPSWVRLRRERVGCTRLGEVTAMLRQSYMDRTYHDSLRNALSPTFVFWRLIKQSLHFRTLHHRPARAAGECEGDRSLPAVQVAVAGLSGLMTWHALPAPSLSALAALCVFVCRLMQYFISFTRWTAHLCLTFLAIDKSKMLANGSPLS